MLTAQHLGTKLDYEAIAAAGSILGSASIIVLDEDTDIPWATQKMIAFFKHESCGKCTPCREGTYWMLTLLERINSGKGTLQDVELLPTVASQITGRTLCPLGDFATSPITGSMKWFKPEYENKVKTSGNGAH
jgi:NADH-quinone oxidoreductase subunit F